MEIAILPDFIINLLPFNKDKKIHINIFLSNFALLLFIVFISYHINILDKLPHGCLFNEMLRIPCPGCGILRSFMAISRLDLATALYYNSMGIFIVLSIIIQMFIRIIGVVIDGFDRFIVIFSKISNIILVVGLIIIWLLKIKGG